MGIFVSHLGLHDFLSGFVGVDWPVNRLEMARPSVRVLYIDVSVTLGPQIRAQFFRIARTIGRHP